ncbi:MAG TPA: LON peptidase substrate-binding domain-containing protein [Candidatus Binataceae bacterium]|nr:LON peptidase substrate-binding domain-containing protein [Candidatus Binataceae bacterium]
MAYPERIALFPLPNVVLFPTVELPLHVFEPRYRQMIAEVGQRDGILGMVLLKGDWEPRYYGKPDLYRVGCAGRIERLVKLPDGRYNFVLRGFSEFEIIEEFGDLPYRQARVGWPAMASSDPEPSLMAALQATVLEYGGSAASEAWRVLVEQRGLAGTGLLNFLCFHLDLDAVEKQSLLEARERRAAALVEILKFRLAQRAAGSGGGQSTLLQ